jgi:L-fuculose-phosphate aldolase
MNSKLMHPRDQIVLIMERIYRFGMTTTSGGNLSIVDESGDLWITPASVDKGSISARDIICVRKDGTIEGIHKPSSEYPFHLAVYKKRPDVRAVLHAHPAALVACSIVHRLPDTRLMPQVEYICGKPGYAPYALPGSEHLGANIAEEFAKGHNTVMLENHGIVTAGETLFEAFQRFETLDFCARIELKARTLGEVRPLSDEQLNMMRTARNLLPEFESEGHTSREKELRKQMCGMIRRAYEHELITSTGGTFSVRIGGDEFLITPNGLDRKYLEEGDLILVRRGERETGKVPSRSVLLHREIYRRHPQINAVIIAHPPNVMAFGVSGIRFDARTIPESYYVLRDIPALAYGTQFMDTETLTGKLSKNVPAVLVENDCLIVTGESLLQAFDRLEVAEFSAHAILQAKALGPVKAITEKQVAELHAAFNKRGQSLNIDISD